MEGLGYVYGVLWLRSCGARAGWNLAELRGELDRGLLAYAGRRFKLSPDLRVLLDAGCPAS